MINARAIVNVAIDMGLGTAGAYLGLLTAITESDLLRYTNPKFPVTATVDNDGPPPEKYAYSTKDSAGLFQQRPKWWGSGTTDDRYRQLMDAATSARLFFNEVVKIRNWRDLEPWDVAQRVQQSEYDGVTNWENRGVLPYAQNYKDRSKQAGEWLAAINKGSNA